MIRPFFDPSVSLIAKGVVNLLVRMLSYFRVA